MEFLWDYLELYAEYQTPERQPEQGVTFWLGIPAVVLVPLFGICSGLAAFVRPQ
jgi:hypothetical protein